MEIANGLVDSSLSENEIGMLVMGRYSPPRVKRFVKDVVNAYAELEVKEQVLIEKHVFMKKFNIFTGIMKHLYNLHEKIQHFHRV